MIKERLWLTQYKQEIEAIVSYFPAYHWTILPKDKYTYSVSTTLTKKQIEIILGDGLSGFFVSTTIRTPYIEKETKLETIIKDDHIIGITRYTGRESIKYHESKHYGSGNLSNKWNYSIENSLNWLSKKLE